jgi:prevent-host-death family protein
LAQIGEPAMNDAAERLSCAEARERFEDLLDRAVKQKERVVLTRRGRPVAALVPITDVEFLEAIEGRLEAEEYRRAKEEFEGSGEAATPWEKFKAELGL